MADIRQPQMELNFEQTWGALQETGRQITETQQEPEWKTEATDQRMKELQKNLDDLVSYFGELEEYLVMPGIIHTFDTLNYHFTSTAKNCKIYNPETCRVEAEFDLFLENDEYNIVVELRTAPDENDVADHINRLKFLRSHRDKQGDKRKIRGAIVGAIMPDKVRQLALHAGLYVIEQSEGTFKIEEPPQIYDW